MFNNDSLITFSWNRDQTYAQTMQIIKFDKIGEIISWSQFRPEYEKPESKHVLTRLLSSESWLCRKGEYKSFC